MKNTKLGLHISTGYRAAKVPYHSRGTYTVVPCFRYTRSISSSGRQKFSR